MKTNSQKYKQIIIPEVSTENWKSLSLRDAQKKMAEYYRTNYPYTRVVKNQHLGIEVGFESEGITKTCKGGKTYPEKCCLIEILDEGRFNFHYSMSINIWQ